MFFTPMKRKQFARIFSAQPWYLDGHIITVEVDVARGRHRFDVVGLASKAVEESRSRVGSSLKNCGFGSPKHSNLKTVVSLAPAEMRKDGSYFDVAMALGYMKARGEIDFDPTGKLFLGELSLDGDVGSVRGVLALVQKARDEGFVEVFVPADNAFEAGFIDGITIYACRHLTDIAAHLDPRSCRPRNGAPERVGRSEASNTAYTAPVDMSDVRGQELAKRGLLIAAAGGHNIAMSGPPGTGKTMLAKAFTGIMPALSEEHMLEVMKIHSIAGVANMNEGGISFVPPLRSPHHTASAISITGGGGVPRPGEITLAHRGVLFMDEFPEFPSQVLEALRQPLEDRLIHIARVNGQATFPADIILLAALNPCPCGYYGTGVKECVCGVHQRERYAKKLSGPIVDRIDIWLSVEHIDYEHFQQENYTSDTSASIRAQVERARTAQYARNGAGVLNRHLGARQVSALALAPEAEKVLQQSARSLSLSPRSYHRIIKLARTIADLEGKKDIQKGHILEALQYRPKI